MDPIRQPRVKKKDRTGVWISIGAHVAVIAIALFILSRTELGRQLRDKIIGASTTKKAAEAPKPPPAAPRAKGPPPKALDAPPPSSGPRKAADAPPPVGEGFGAEVAAKGKGGPAAGGPETNRQLRVVAPVIPKVVIPRPAFQSAAGASTISALLAQRSKAAASIESIGSEQFSKVGAGDAGAIIKNISGATVTDGKFAVIRGLNDRYVSTTLNGANLPSADPYRQSAPLDLFPAQVIDRVVVAKTYTPDQPGSATGGSIDVYTKAFPEKPFLSVSFGGEYNTQSSLNERFLTYTGGGLDWAGMDDGTRALPSTVSHLAPIGQKFPDAPTTSGLINSSLYFQSLSNATLVDKVSRELGATEFGPKRETSPLNHNFSGAGGGTAFLFGQPLGYFASGGYKHDYGFYENGISSRYQNGTELKNQYRDARSLQVVNWSAMVNLAYKPFEDHELGFTYFYNQNGTDETRIQDQGFEDSDNSAIYRKFNLYYIERNLNTYQMKGEHHLPDAANLQFNWLVALTETTQDEPDARFFNDATKGGEYSTVFSSLPSPSKPTRYFRTLEENNRNVKLDWTLPFRNWRMDDANFKFGLFSSHSDRDFVERQFYYPNSQGGYHSDPALYLPEENLGLGSITTNILNGRPRSLRFNWDQYVQIFDSLYNGTRDVKAGYLMLDLPVLPKARLVGGVRYETTDLFVHSESYLDSSITSKRTNDTRLEQTDLLPAVGLIYSLTSNMNIRVNYSKTIARPSFRELAAYYSYDPTVSDFVEGNPLLRMSAINNYDLRYEWFPNAGELYSVSVFYKDITDAIERGNIKQEGDVITFRNNDAKLYGVEFEARRNLGFLDYCLKNFTLGANLSLVKSEVKLSDTEFEGIRKFIPDAKDTRPLYDQSPYVLNIDLNYNNPRSGTGASLIFNVAGPRIAITKLNTEDVYEQPAPVLDFILSQKLGRQMTVKFGAKNLLNPKIERTYGKTSDLIYSSYTRGRAFALSLTYDF